MFPLSLFFSFYFRQHRYRISSQGTKAERVVFKSGLFNLERSKKFKYRVVPDIVAAFVEARWRWTLMYCIFTYIFIWVFFASVWWIILYAHGDFESDHLPPTSNATEWTPCVKEIYGFTSIFLFSIEIHTTIGYGTRTITLECPSAMLTMCLESIVGTITQAFIVGIVFAKLTRPKNRAQSLLFSKNAIINQRNKNLCLLFRIGDTRKSRIISVSVHAFLIRCVTAKSELDEQIKLNLSVDSSNTISFVFPLTAVHTIDEKSPFYFMSAKDILKSELEILVVFEGTIESTGQPVQITSSYTAQEILWGHRFAPMIEYNRAKQGHVVDFKKFDETFRINTPLCAAERLKHLYR